LWQFLEILGLHGINSVRDVLVRPPFLWRPCIPDIAHALAVTIDFAACQRQEKNDALDFCLNASDLGCIPFSDQWVLNPLDPNLTGSAKEGAIRQGHQQLVNYLQDQERWLSSPVLSSEFGLYYRLGPKN
jgi:hypothetical protein